ncbi:MAG: dihydrolipoyl dehydrogenase [Bacteroidaceae bacterium]|nr:dihydrolipoyl dehydrogenase [Bacteroidaceae bacterium]
MYDLAIIGGGPAGYVAAENAGANGMKVILFEKRELGGVCLNEGCIPTKTLLYSAKMYDHAQGGKKYGVTAENVTYDYKKIADRKTKVVRKLVAGIKMKMEHNNIEVVRGNAFIKSGDTESIIIECNNENYTAAKLLICTGSEAFIPPIQGIENNDAILTNREALALTAIPESIIIVGGGVIGMEFASIYNSLGIPVKIVEMQSEILGNTDKEISGMLRSIYSKKGVEFNLGCKVTAIDGHTLHYIDPEGNNQSIEADKILISVGRRPVVEGYGLENIAVEVNRGVKVNSYMQTTMPNVYAAGDVTGFSLLAHTASREGEVAINHMLGIADEMKYNAIPGVVYTNPEVSSVGITEEEAIEKGIGYKISKLPMTYAGRFVAENEGITGLCKIIVTDDNKVIGAHILGNTSSEFICAACIAITHGLGIEELRRTVFPHPTACEILKEAVFEL